MNQRALGNLVQHWGSKITSDLFLKVLDVKKAHSALLCSMNNHLSLAFLHSLNHVPFFFFFFAIICNRFHKCVKISGFFPPLFLLLYCQILSAGEEDGEPGGLLSPGGVHLRQPGVLSPRGTDCNLDVRGENLASSGGGTYPQEMLLQFQTRTRSSPHPNDFFFCHAKLRFLDCTNPHVSKEPAHIAFQLLGKLKRNAAPHFCNTFSGGERARLSAL